jgi:hypothetical protein
MGKGTGVLYNLYQEKVTITDRNNVMMNLDILTEKFFNPDDIELLNLIEELTAA